MIEIELKDPPPRDQHEHYPIWAEKNGYLKRRIDEACVRIAELVVENKRLKATITSLEQLPLGKQNLMRK